MGRSSVLVVEDNDLERQITADTLREEGFNVEEAATGKRALECLGLGEFADRAGLVDKQEPQAGREHVPAPDGRRDRAVTDRFEPGSVMKPFMMAGALAAGTLKPIVPRPPDVMSERDRSCL